MTLLDLPAASVLVWLSDNPNERIDDLHIRDFVRQYDVKEHGIDRLVHRQANYRVIPRELWNEYEAMLGRHDRERKEMWERIIAHRHANVSISA